MQTTLGSPRVQPEETPNGRGRTLDPVAKTVDEKPNPVIEQARQAPQRGSDFDANTRTPNPGNVESWAAAFNASSNAAQTGPRFAMPDNTKKTSGTKWLIVALLLLLMLGGAAAGAYVFLMVPQEAEPSISLNSPNKTTAEYTVFVAGVQLNAGKPMLEINDTEEKEALVWLKSDKSIRWEFTLPSIVYPSELVLLLENGKVKVGRVRL